MNKTQVKRDVDELVQENKSSWKKDFVYIKKGKVRSWKVLISLVFLLGASAAIFLAVYYKIQTKSMASTGTATLIWNANTEADLGGYKIYYGETKRTGDCPRGDYTAMINAGKETSYTIDNLTEGKTYYFSITAYNTAGAESCFSAETSKYIPISVVSDTTAPTVSISSPSGGATVSSSINVTATATDASGVAKVEFYVDNILKSSDTTAPYGYNLDTTKISNAAHTLSAKAYDAANNSKMSALVNVSVRNATTCSSFTYSDWDACQSDGTQLRTVLSSSPDGCSGGVPVTSQSCTFEVTPVTATTCTSFKYSKWSACMDGIRTRTVSYGTPSGCTGGSPVLSESCKKGR